MTFRLNRFWHGCTTVVAFALLQAYSLSAHAAWPLEQPIKITIPYALGSMTDQVARIITPELSKALGQEIQLENYPAESGRAGVAYAIEQKPDGYNLLYASSGALVIDPNLQASQKSSARNYPLRDLSPISLIGVSPLILTINKDWGTDTLQGFVKRAKDNPGKYHIGSDGVGSNSHSVARLFLRATQTDFLQVPYSSSQQMVSALHDNQVQALFIEPGAILDTLKQNKLIVLSKTSSAKLPHQPLLDGVPSFTSLGYNELDTIVWHAMLAPAGTPTRIIHRLHDALQSVLEDPQVVTKIQALYFTPQGSTPHMLKSRMELETEQWRQKFKALSKGAAGR